MVETIRPLPFSVFDSDQAVLIFSDFFIASAIRHPFRENSPQGRIAPLKVNYIGSFAHFTTSRPKFPVGPAGRRPFPFTDAAVTLTL